MNKVPITIRALKQRINRKLSNESQALKTNRSASFASDLGDYYIVDMQTNSIVSAHVELVKLGHELGVIKEWEKLDD